jgi:hypothetical protein
MAYLTYDEYTEYPIEHVDEEHFNKLLFRAEMALNGYLVGFSSDNTWDSLNNALKVKIKLATAMMIDYYASTGKVSLEDRQNQAQSQSIGRTSVSFATQSSSQTTELPADVLAVLRGTGFLGRGVPYVR